jgi:acyl carrier protein
VISYCDAELTAMGPDIISLLRDVEESFDIDVPDEEWEQASTIGEIYEIVCGALGKPVSKAPDGTPTWEQLLDVIEENTSIRRSILEFDADLAEDLKLR